MHEHERWFRFNSESKVLRLTSLYDWYGGDFEQVAGSVIAYAARYSPELEQAVDSGEESQVRWIDYDWSLNSLENRAAHRERSANDGG